nr:hypothetical protein [Tanacetum cinerariifolium]GEY51104.1 hypothetical protein [Tanacetum cinerariifolium]
MYYPRFTKVIINHFMSQDQSIPRRNTMDWNMAKDDPILTTMRFIPQHEVVQKYDAIFLDNLTNQAIKESEAYKTYYGLATGKVISKPKYKKLPAQGLENLSEISLTETEQMKIVTKRSKMDFNSSHASGSGADEGTGVSPGVLDVPIYGSEDEQISWKSSDDKDDDEVSLSKDDAENDDDLRVHTPSYYESVDDKTYDDVTQRDNVEEEKMDEEETNEEEDVNELYRDVNVNLEGRDTEMTDALLPNVQVIQVIEDTHGSKRRRARNEPESSSAPKEKTSKSTGKSKEGSKSHQKSIGKSGQTEEPIHTADDLEEPAPQEFNTGFTEDQPVKEASQLPDWFQKPAKPPTLYHDSRDSFNELMETPLDFSAFVMNRLKVDTMTAEVLVGLTFELTKGSCKSLVELEYFLKEVYKATTDQLDWNNTEGQQYPHDLRKPLPLIPNLKDRRVIPFDHFINNDLAYLSGGASSRTYATSVTKTNAADYGHIKWIEDLVSNTMWSPVPIFEWHNYKQLDWITVRRDDDKLYTFKEGDYKRLCLQDIEDMLLFLVQGKLTNLTIEEHLALNVSLRMFTRSIVIQRRVEDLQIGVKSYQKKLNLIRPDTYRSNLKILPTYSAYPNPRGFIYQNKDKKNKLMRIKELHKFSDDTLNDVQTALADILKRIKMKYLPQTFWRNVDKEKAGAMIQAIDKQLKNIRIKRSLEKFVGRRSYEGYFWLLKRTI